MLVHVLEREIEREMENVGAGTWAAPLCHVFLKILLMCLLAWRTEMGRRGGGGVGRVTWIMYAFLCRRAQSQSHPPSQLAVSGEAAPNLPHAPHPLYILSCCMGNWKRSYSTFIRQHYSLSFHTSVRLSFAVAAAVAVAVTVTVSPAFAIHTECKMVRSLK